MNFFRWLSWFFRKPKIKVMKIPGGPDNLAKAVKYLSANPDVTVLVEAEYSAQEAAQ